MTDLPPPPDAPLPPPPPAEAGGSRLGRWKDKAVDLAGKANDARIERAATKAEREAAETAAPVDPNEPVAEFNQSRFTNTVHPERLVVYPDRVEFAAKGIIRKDQATIGFSDLAQVRVTSGFRHAKVIIESSGGASIEIDDMPKGDADDARQLILDTAAAWRNRRANPDPAPAPPAAPPAADDVAAQLANLASLHQSGALTDDEFAAAKACLLT